ncbi:hypothetical protein M8J75_007599 [Diaphorina citri]|nr:hypothetical protein M8J75_007599 [Diaphorina citri]
MSAKTRRRTSKPQENHDPHLPDNTHRDISIRRVKLCPVPLSLYILSSHLAGHFHHENPYYINTRFCLKQIPRVELERNLTTIILLLEISSVNLQAMWPPSTYL